MRLCRGSCTSSRCRQTETHSIISRPVANGRSQSVEIKCCNNTAATTAAAAMATHGGSNPTFRLAFIVGDNNEEAMQMPAAHKASHPLFLTRRRSASCRGVRIFPLYARGPRPPLPRAPRPLPTIHPFYWHTGMFALRDRQSSRLARSVCRFHEFHL